MKFQAAGILLFTLLAAGCSAQSPSCGDPETLAKLKEAVVKAVSVPVTVKMRKGCRLENHGWG